jgi:hypothetical protein
VNYAKCATHLARYRPVRIGWVISDRNVASLAKAAGWSSCLWGGQFNPVIPIRDPAADQLVKAFALDVLIPVDTNDAARTFIERFPYLTHERWRQHAHRLE